jgi:hypothetical protein
MKIVLIRHGEPKIDLSDILKTTFSVNELKNIFSVYIDSGLNTQKIPSPEAFRVTKTGNTVCCSDLPRSIESATALGVLDIDFVNSILSGSEWIRVKP